MLVLEISTAVYHAAVEDSVAGQGTADLMRSIPDTRWIPEYQTGEEIWRRSQFTVNRRRRNRPPRL